MKKRKIRVANKKRFLIFLLSVTTIVFLVISILSENTKVYSSEYEAKYIEVKVEKGDTIWNIAVKNKPKDYDTRKMVYEIMENNKLQTASIHPGDVIRVPIKRNE